MNSDRLSFKRLGEYPPVWWLVLIPFLLTRFVLWDCPRWAFAQSLGALALAAALLLTSSLGWLPFHLAFGVVPVLLYVLCFLVVPALAGLIALHGVRGSVGVFKALTPAAALSWLRGLPGWISLHFSRRGFLRRWEEACVSAKVLGERTDRLGNVLKVLPRVVSYEEYPGGSSVVRVSLPDGISPETFAQKASTFASAFQMSSVQVAPDPRNQNVAILNFVSATDPLFSPVLNPPHWDWLTATGGDPLEPYVCGELVGGEFATVKLFEDNVICSGKPGSGKSVWVHEIIQQFVRREHTELTILDPKGGIEFQSVASLCKSFYGFQDEKDDNGEIMVGSGMERDISAFDEFLSEMARREQYALDRNLRKIEPCKEFPLRLIIIDELASLTGNPDRKIKEKATKSLAELVRKGRALGISFILLLQYPKADVLDTHVRALIQQRVMFHIAEKTASDVVLGEDQADIGADASSLPPDVKGLGFIRKGDRVGQLLRTYYLSDEDLTKLVADALDYKASIREPALVEVGCSEHVGKLYALARNCPDCLFAQAEATKSGDSNIPTFQG